MNLMDILESTAGRSSVNELGKEFGLGQSEAGDLFAAVAPALLRGLQKQTDTDDGARSLKRALETGNHQRYLDDPQLMHTDETRMDGNKILSHIFGSKDVSRNVAAHAAQNTGIDANLIKKALPMLAGLAMGMISKQSSAGRELGQAGSAGGLGSLAGLIDDEGDGVGLDDVIGLARKFF